MVTVSADLEQARQARARGEHAQAVRHLRKLLVGSAERDCGAELELARVLFAAGHLQWSDRYCESILAKRPRLASALLLSARVALTRANALRALTQLDKLESKQAEKVEVLVLRVSCLQAAGRSQQADALCRQVLASDPAEAFRRRAANALAESMKGDLQALLAHWQALVEKWPDWPHARTCLGNALLTAQRYREAQAAFSEVERLAPESVEALLGLGQSAEARKDYPQAVRYFRAALQRRPEAASIGRRLHKALLASDPAEAARIVRRRLELNPGDTDATAGLVMALSEAGEHSEAIRLLVEARKLNPDDARFLSLQRSLRALVGQFDFADELYWALRITQEGDASAANVLAACRLLIMYGITSPARVALEQRASQDGWARDLLDQVTELERRGLSIPFPSRLSEGDLLLEECAGLSLGMIEKARQGAETLVLFFAGARGQGGGLALVVWQHLFARAGVSVIYLRDLDRSFGLTGYHGLASSFSSSIEELRKRTREYGAKRVLAIGTSGGCAAALRFGLMLEVEAILGLGTILNADLDRLPPSLVGTLERVRAEVPGMVRNIGEIYRDHGAYPPTTLVYAAENQRDRRDASELEGLRDVSALPIEGYANHNVVSLLLSSGLFSRVVECFLRTGRVDPALSEAVTYASLERAGKPIDAVLPSP